MRKAPATVALAPIVALAVVMPAAPADAARRCGHLDVDRGFPGVRDIRAEHVRCWTGRRIARAVQREWQRTDGPVSFVRGPDGRLWRCRYEMREFRGDRGRYVFAGCRKYGQARRRVTMKLVS